jgi:hypothetical protein
MEICDENEKGLAFPECNSKPSNRVRLPCYEAKRLNVRNYEKNYGNFS